MPQKPVAALSEPAQAVYAVLHPDTPQPAETIAELVADQMSASTAWDALQELEVAVRAAQVMGGWTALT